jgi:hypothetical protein
MRLLREDRLAHPDWQVRAPDLEGFQRDLGVAGDWLASEHERASRMVRTLVTASGPGKPGLPKVTILHGRAWLQNEGDGQLTRLDKYMLSFLDRGAWSMHRNDVEAGSVAVEDLRTEFALTLHARAWRLEVVEDDDSIYPVVSYELCVATLDEAAIACRAAARIRYLSEAPGALRRVVHLLRHDLIRYWYRRAQSSEAR